MKVLVVEDDALVALDLAEMIAELGHEVVGPVMTVEAALSKCRSDPIAFAILDFNLGKETSAPIADELARQRVSFVFLTGYLKSALPDRFQATKVLPKPIHLAVLEEVIAAADRRRL